MELLPDEPERAHLIDELARLVAVEGGEAFLSAPLVEPSDRFFPDRWTPDAAGVERLLRRLLDYARLTGLDLALEVDRFSNPTGEVLRDGTAGGHDGTAAWFAGIRDATCRFGVDTLQLRDPVGLVGTLAHEVAHAYRHARELRVPDAAVEEPLTDLTTVYLGFGILTANASQRFRSGGAAGASWYSRAEGGYLGMRSMCYLVAVQAVARGTAPGATARLLAPNQRACFKAACKALGARAELLARLGLPPAGDVPTETARTSWLRRLFGA